MSLRDVLAYVQQQQQTGVRVTPVTPENSTGLQPEPAWIGACTPVTPATPHFGDTQANAPKPAPELTDCTAAPATPQHTPHQYGITFSAQLKRPVPAPGQHHADTVPTPQPQPEPTDWLILDRTYQAHHFKCAICIAAGKGYGARCGAGAALWTAYDEASRNTPPPWHQPKKGQRHD